MGRNCRNFKCNRVPLQTQELENIVQVLDQQGLRGSKVRHWACCSGGPDWRWKEPATTFPPSLSHQKTTYHNCHTSHLQAQICPEPKAWRRFCSRLTAESHFAYTCTHTSTSLCSSVLPHRSCYPSIAPKIVCGQFDLRSCNSWHTSHCNLEVNSFPLSPKSFC